MILTVTANAAVDRRYVMEKMNTGEVNRVREVSMSAGGKGLNVSRAAKIAGEDVVATGFLGGFHGKFIQSELIKEGIGDGFIFCHGETRSCINIWNEELKQQTELLEPGLSVTEKDEEELVKNFENLIKTADAAAISGSLPKGAGASLYGKLIKAGQDAGKRVILDTSGKTLIESIKYKPYMIKPNIDEIRQITGFTIDENDIDSIKKAALKLRDSGISVVVVSLGSKGAIMVCGEGVYMAAVPKIEAVNTVGCGDSMIAGFCVALSKNMSMPDCLRYASAVASASAMTEKTGYFRKEDAENIFKEIKISEI